MWNARRSLREWRIEDSPRQIRLTKGEARDIMGNDVREYTMRMVQEASAEANREATPAPPLRRPPGDSWKNLKHKMAMQSTAKSKEAARKQSLIDDWVNILGNVFQRNRSQPTLDTHTRGTETDDSDWSVTHSESNRDLSVGEEEHEEGPQHVGGAEASIRQMNSLAREQVQDALTAGARRQAIMKSADTIGAFMPQLSFTRSPEPLAPGRRQGSHSSTASALRPTPGRRSGPRRIESTSAV
ncbi:hypothetical protein AB1Y20_008862 [Prymnesium parvum]|uniref:Uncharacterized protein n=1 Tax=Prymnesium parvum TaxID=97485 RepID=A0AB34IV25_PRYPA|mmetsp:Transcript_12228/g.30441  ORF Transcript_12228/g.30441 Transcript_12228/m.30441 type:complete len:242 (-) Transcript_12228:485-1210(-)